MKKTLLTCALMVSLACSALSQSRLKVKLGGVLVSAVSAVFNLRANHRSFCTAFAVEDRGKRRLLSAGHCAEGLNGTTIVEAFDFQSGERYPVKLESYRYHWPEVDYSIFTFIGKVPLHSLRLSNSVPKVGDPIWTVEGPLGYTPFFTNGIYSGRIYCADQHEEVSSMYLVTLVSAPGASGSPILDRYGRVWAILVGGDDELPNVALVVLPPHQL